ncbi:DNA-directed RNA polymerase subunit alpha C-terminal domain-containing protein [Sphingomonas panni]|uniref:DNA-directed RNA polymerase subunit alpha C-terminal domain-containing protein n=1 Tax=Sphingomonas panni TaxID=237612 RepID=UPI001F5B3439|nr:DNA-directed RNA polymerase subunit alpha C-terminal domain-containing protein [Sphingomonas panni]
MSRTQQIIATHDTFLPDASPMEVLRRAVSKVSEGLPPIFVSIDALHPYPIRDLSPPDWLLVSADGERSTFMHTDWRKVIEAAPQETLVVLLSKGQPSNVPSEVVRHVDLTGWHGDASDRRIEMVALLIANGASAWRHDHDGEHEAVRRGALLHVGDGTTTLNPKLLWKTVDLNVSNGTLRLLQQQNMIHIGDLVQKTEAEVLRIPSLGRKRLDEIKIALGVFGLMLGTTIPGWPPETMEAALADAHPTATLSRTPQAPAGEMFTSAGDRLAIDPAIGILSDREAGASPMSVQLQASIRRKLQTLSPIASRLGNQQGWQDLAPLCDRLTQLLERPGLEIPDVLGSLYGAALELGSYVEMDAAARNDPQSAVDALDPSAARPLQDVLTGMAPWLRRFPTIRELDDEAGRFLVAQSSAKASREAFAAAAETNLIREADADLLRRLLDAGDRGDFVGSKASRRGVISAKNLILTAALFVGGGVWDGAVSEYAAHSVVARRAGAMLVKAENAILEIVAEMPADVRSAIRHVMTRTRAADGPTTKNMPT